MTPPIPRTATAADWRRFTPRDLATLTFVVDDGHILLIRKKRGLGAGKINGPGGRLEPGETPERCAVREVEEELLVTPRGLSRRGRLDFQFVDGYSLRVWVFRADGCRGEPRETAEAEPRWTPVDAIPYDEMWEDDRIWLPRMLAGERFRGRFVFEEERLLSWELDRRPSNSSSKSGSGSESESGSNPYGSASPATQ